MDASPGNLSREQIRSIYESGPEQVIAVVTRLQSEINSLTKRASKLEARVSFDNFLLYLSADRGRAAERYNQLQQSLISFFAARGSSDPESRAEETLEILCRQVAEGRRFEDLEKYSIGVARNVLIKEQDRRGQNRLSLHDLQTDYDLRFSSPPQQALTESEADENLSEDCMRSCLGGLPDADRRLIIRYSEAGGQDKGAREELAKDARVTLEALRVRVHRIRSALKKCLSRCRKKIPLRL